MRHSFTVRDQKLLLDLDDFRPQHLCPEQRVQMVSDLYGSGR